MTLYEGYIKEIEKLKAESEGRIIAVIPEVEKFAYTALNEWIDQSLDIRGGKFFASQETIDILNDFDGAYLRVLNQMKAYQGAVSSFVKDLSAISDAMKEFQIAENGIKWPGQLIGDSQKLVVNEILKAYTDNGLNRNFVQPLRDLMYQNIVAGTDVTEAKSFLKTYIISGKDESGKLKSYLTQTSQMAVDGYTGMINKKLMDTFDYPFLIMSGSLIATSSPQCRKAIREFGGIFSEEEFEKTIEPLANKNGLVDGTTFDNLPFNKLHWGCRHEFTPAMLKPGDKIGENEVFRKNGNNKRKSSDKNRQRGFVRSYDKGQVKTNLNEYHEFKKGYKQEYFNYRSGGYVVVQDGHGLSELENNLITAKLLAKRSSKVILVKNAKGGKTPDAILNGTEVEFKMIKDAGKNISNAVQNHFNRAVGQSRNLLIHINQKYSLKDLVFGLKKAVEKNYGQFDKVSLLFRNGNTKELIMTELKDKNENELLMILNSL